MQITSFAATNIGQKRESNEDALLIDPRLNLFIVCDGMGGHAAGEVASEKASQIFAGFVYDNEDLLQEAHAKPDGYFRILELAEAAMVETSRRVHEMAATQADLAGMGTTVTALIVVDDKAVMAHVGDSRLYLQRDNQIHQLSTDHTLANELALQGALTLDSTTTSPYQHVLTRSVGSVAAVESEMLLFDILPEDTLLLTTDGLTNHLEDNDELMRLLAADDLSDTPQALVDLANARGGQDNITCIVVRAEAESSKKALAELTRQKAAALKATFLGRGLSYHRLIRLVAISRVRTCASGEVLLHLGDPCHGLTVVVDGSLKLTSASGRERTVGKSSALFETALVHPRKSQATVTACEPSIVLELSRDEFDRLVRRFPKAGRQMMTQLVTYLADQLDEISERP